MKHMFATCVGVSVCLQVAQADNSGSETADLDTALWFDDDCAARGEGSCALELAQLRTTKFHSHESHSRSSDTKSNSKARESKQTPARVDSKTTEDAQKEYRHPAWIHSCQQIFIDVGCNIGVSVRKLFEPNKYPGAKLLPFFDEHFGDPSVRRSAGDKTGLCALGIEPNPDHKERLQEIEEAYQKQGWHVHFYPVAAWSSDGQMPFNRTGQRPSPDSDLTHTGAHLSMHLAEGQHVPESSLVDTINFAAFVESLPANTVKLMLMDIEGAEYETLAQLMMEKKLCKSSILNLLVEAHDWGDITKWGGPSSFSEGVHPRSTMAIGERVSQMTDMGWCASGDNVTYVAKLDDETYSKDVDANFGEP